MQALLMLEDGWSCNCESFTGEGEGFGELVFNTGLTGYQEVITDPSYHGQIVMMTNTMIGNYGIRDGEDESLRVHAKGFVVKEYSGEDLDTNFRVPVTDGQKKPEFSGTDPGPKGHKDKFHTEAEAVHNRVQYSLSNFLRHYHVPGVEGVDTRALTKHIREHGAMKAGITTKTLDRAIFLEMVKNSPGLAGRDLVKDVTTYDQYMYSRGNGYRTAVLDCGVKTSILRQLAARDCTVEVFPADATISDIMRTG
jgi:carbamoyl-phosphate synthase small subunit